MSREGCRRHGLGERVLSQGRRAGSVVQRALVVAVVVTVLRHVVHLDVGLALCRQEARDAEGVVGGRVLLLQVVVTVVVGA